MSFIDFCKTTMNLVAFFCSCLPVAFAALSFLWMPDCAQSGLDSCTINYKCTGEYKVVPRQSAPTAPEWGLDCVGIGVDHRVYVPIMNVTWMLKSDASLQTLQGSQLHIIDKQTNQSVCLQFTYSVKQQLDPNFRKWTFSLSGLVVEPGRTYTLLAFNLPKPDVGDYAITKQVTIPGCDDKRIQNSQMCLENGSLWDAQVTTALSAEKHQKLLLFVGFEVDEHSDIYQVSIQSDGIHFSKNVSKENRTSLNVTFALDVSKLLTCQLLLTIKPFFTRCKNDGCRPQQIKINCCSYFPPRTTMIKGSVGLVFAGVCFVYLLRAASYKNHGSASSLAVKQQPQYFQVEERKRVFILYSLDHPLYKNIILKFCAFLTAKCGTEVILDLLDSTRLGTLGRLQWLDWQRERIEGSSDKILLLCSQGVRAKWRAMCGEKRVLLKEDLRSPVGDMLTPALGLVVPHLVRHASFEKYMVAYFEDVGSPEDVPPPFNVTVRYKLMKQFEELFFRILDTEKHGPGRVCHIEGLAEGEYHRCPSGRALQEALEAFREYQLEHPRWFDEERVEDLEVEEQVL
ncbi:interleukin-17 receptor A [Syngnathus typhle]|uniref:interleukin-17 receptor A n=1 Tax=Syngnathus typhle TaxID=161592 RepID=UPI002A6A84C4|nr:interleukin-17 receptor A [Syngnathus typhle]XP_061138698.1 interleukin-17 receptor A [Syngnathus typhle]